MGQFFQFMFGKRKSNILMVGLDAAGKTTILFYLKLGTSVSTIPTIGFNSERITYGGLTFTIMDVGGQEKTRLFWKHYYDNTQVDSSDRERLKEAKEELKRMLDDPLLSEACLLILANKQDLENCLSSKDIETEFELNDINQKFYIQPCCAINGEGIYDGLTWLAKNVEYYF
eukprot:gene4847-8432_t